jgi:uncharacterized protein (TIGR00290 family)
MIPCIFNWSGGKDSALALYYCLQNPDLDIRYLVTTINDDADRISMHGVRTELLIRQAENIGIELYQIRLPEMPGMTEYDDAMRYHFNHLKSKGISHAIFGDIFLEDLKTYRDAQLAEAGLAGIYPLWKRDTNELIREFLSLGFGTVIACAQQNLNYIAGQELDLNLLSNLPVGVDVCGENGEFHTFTFKGPIFKNSIKYKTGEMVFKSYKAPENSKNRQGKIEETTPTGFWFCDLLLA